MEAALRTDLAPSTALDALIFDPRPDTLRRLSTHVTIGPPRARASP